MALEKTNGSEWITKFCSRIQLHLDVHFDEHGSEKLWESVLSIAFDLLNREDPLNTNLRCSLNGSIG
jgi:hypothetical protein